MTAQDVRDAVAEFEGDGIVSQMAAEIWGWSAQVWNWAFATLLGDADLAPTLLTESHPVAPGYGMFGNPEYLDDVTDDAERAKVVANAIVCASARDPVECLDGKESEREERQAEISAEALLWSMILSHSASVFAAESEFLSDTTDPEGYIRQRMRCASPELWRASETVLAIAPVADAE